MAVYIYILILFVVLIILFLYKKNTHNLIDEYKKHGSVVLNPSSILSWGGIYKSTDKYIKITPYSENDLSKIVKLAYSNNIQIRTQGNNHSHNGIAIPKKNELLISTSKLSNFHINDDIITVGSGLNFEVLDKILLPLGYKFAVRNDGGLGPSVGGYISAGGLSPTCKNYGGFWETVISINLIICDGRIIEITKDDPIFKWVFGSMGQLGIITQVKIKVIPIDKLEFDKLINAPHLKQIECTLTDDNIEFTIPNLYTSDNYLYWIQLFASNADEESKLTEELKTLNAKYNYILPVYYRWEVPFKTFNPPLVYPNNKSFVSIGFWGIGITKTRPLDDIISFTNEFANIVLEKNYYSYIQVETVSDINYFRKYWGDEIYNTFRDYKKYVDPKFLFNKGNIFE